MVEKIIAATYRNMSMWKSEKEKYTEGWWRTVRTDERKWQQEKSCCHWRKRCAVATDGKGELNCETVQEVSFTHAVSEMRAGTWWFKIYRGGRSNQATWKLGLRWTTLRDFWQMASVRDGGHSPMMLRCHQRRWDKRWTNKGWGSEFQARQPGKTE